MLDELSTIEAFRQPLPMGIASTDRDESVATVTKVMAEVVAALRDNAATLSSGAAARLSNRHAMQTRPVAVRPLASLTAAAEADIEVCWRHGW